MCLCLHNSSVCLLYTHIDQILANLLHGLLNCDIGGLECRVITTEYRTPIHYIQMYHLFCNALARVIYSGVSVHCSHTITHTYNLHHMLHALLLQVHLYHPLKNTINSPLLIVICYQIIKLWLI